jgi:hypothetical protein
MVSDGFIRNSSCWFEVFWPAHDQDLETYHERNGAGGFESTNSHEEKED